MRDIEIPNGIGAVGYTEADIPDLVPGTMKQQRLLAACPRHVDEEDIARILAAPSRTGNPMPLYDYCCPQGHCWDEMAPIAER